MEKQCDVCKKNNVTDLLSVGTCGDNAKDLFYADVCSDCLDSIVSDLKSRIAKS